MILRREGWRVNPKRIYRLYTEDGLTVRTNVRKKLARRSRVATPKATRHNQKWFVDFMGAKLVDGRWFRVLTVVRENRSTMVISNHSTGGCAMSV